MAVAGGAAAWRHLRAPRRARVVTSTGLDSGIYLFTSSTCPTCGSARSRLDDVVGADGFSEIPWEGDPGVFADLGVDAVPALLVVDPSGDGRLHPGVSRRVIASL
ncbi:MAG: hypothetical protein PVG83_11815 [Acidimicrobiia bacterium]